MWIAVFAGLLVSIDALFIGVSFGTQKRCKFWHIVVINIGLLALCVLGYFLGILIGDNVNFEIYLVIGLLFITLGLWIIASYFVFEHKKPDKQSKQQTKSILLTGIFMSIEAMFITIGLTLTLDMRTILIPLTVGFAHFIYSATTFALAKHLRRFPPMAGHIISGVAIIIYGIMAIVI